MQFDRLKKICWITVLGDKDNCQVLKTSILPILVYSGGVLNFGLNNNEFRVNCNNIINTVIIDGTEIDGTEIDGTAIDGSGIDRGGDLCQ